ncbi:hypothetical protein CBR_g36705 [Chara braunii]|uniref:Uncharacterized protein n=1 Tax=Chara braunii TaxID=69332 RepID=A0A388LLB8_CHABU|nr:hypothetical protein CBR_g36705 [Chara braunii]|eukprot:GBG83087.1 hypothetical protein CBR_g36705 [Chara braunii]
MDQVFHHQIKVERKKRKAVRTIQGTDSVLGGVLSDMANEIKELRERVTPAKALTVTQPSGKRTKEEEDGEEEGEEGEPEGTVKLTKCQRKAKNIAIGGQGSGKGQGYDRGYDQGYGRGFGRENGHWNGQGYGRGWIDYSECTCTHCRIKGHTVKRCHVRKLDERDGLITSNIDDEVFDRTGRAIDPEIPGGTREEALRVAALGPNAPGMFRMWQEKEGPVVRVEDVTESEEKLSRMGIEGSKEDVPLVEEEAEKDDVRINIRDTFDRMKDLVDKIQRLHLRLQGICEEAGKEGVGCPKVLTMGCGESGDGPNEPNPIMLRANMAARNSGGQRSVRGTIPFATRRPARGNPPKEQAQTSQPAEEEPTIMVEGDEDEDEKNREEEERQAEIMAKRRKGEVKEGRSKKDQAPSKKRKYQTSIEEGVNLESLISATEERVQEAAMNVADSRGKDKERRECGDKEKLANVTGAGMYKKRIEGVVAGCTRWRACKVRLWKDMGVFPRDDVENDLRFDGTNLEDFIDSLQLATERGEWSEEEKKQQLIARTEKSEKEEVKGIVEGSRTRHIITAELGIAYTQARQDQTRKERLQERGLRIGREMGELHGKEAEDEEEDDVPLKRLKNKARVVPKSSNKGSGQAKGNEQEEEEEAERRKISMGASAVPRERRTGEKKPVEIGRKEVQEKGSEKEGGAKETGEGKKIQEGGRVPRVERTNGKGPIGDKEGKEGEKGEKEGKLRRAKEVKAEIGKRRSEGGELSQLRKEVEEGQVSKEEKAQKDRKKKGWRDYMIRMPQYDDLPVNSTWDVRFERMLLSELVRC